MTAKLVLLLQAIETGPARLQRVQECIAALKLNHERATHLCGELRQRPGWVANREFKILCDEAPDAMMLPNGQVPKPSKEVLADLAKPGTAYEVLNENQIRSARRRWRGLWTKPLALQTGQQPHVYSPLIRQFIDSIERATGRRITYTRDSSKIGSHAQLGGPRFNVLCAALELALPGSVTARDLQFETHDFPASETIRNVIERRIEDNFAPTTQELMRNNPQALIALFPVQAGAAPDMVVPDHSANPDKRTGED